MNNKRRYPVVAPVLVLFCYLYSSQGYTQDVFKLRGTFPNYKGPVYLDWDGRVDTALVKDGEFQFTGVISLPLRATIRIDAPRPLAGNQTVLEPGETVVTVDTTIARLGGDVLCLMTIRYKKSGPINKAIVPFQEKLKKDVSWLMHSSEEVQRNYVVNNAREMFRKNPNSPGPVFEIVQTGIYEILPPEMLDSLYKGMPKIYQENYFGQRVKSRLEYYSRLTIGSTIRDFTWVDPTGRSVSVSHYKGKYLFIDVWASWCGPCLEELPLLKDLHTRYNGSKFAIVGVSIDIQRERWLKALEKHRLPWESVNDPRDFKAEFLTAFKVESIPFNLLLDPDGKIIAINLHGQDLETTLAEILN